MRSYAMMTALAAAVVAQPAMAEIGRVKSSVGPASIKRGPATIPATAGVKLEKGDIVVTGKAGRVGIAFLDDTRFAVGPESKITISDYSYDRARQSGTSLTSVDRGSLGVVSGNIAKSKKDAMRVKTPTSMLGVRGTKFVVDVKGKGEGES